MKTQLSNPARSKARYTEEYKQEALKLWHNTGRSAAKVAAELDIRAPLLKDLKGSELSALRGSSKGVREGRTGKTQETGLDQKRS